MLVAAGTPSGGCPAQPGRTLRPRRRVSLGDLRGDVGRRAWRPRARRAVPGNLPTRRTGRALCSRPRRRRTCPSDDRTTRICPTSVRTSLSPPGGALVRTRVAVFLATLISALVVLVGLGRRPGRGRGRVHLRVPEERQGQGAAAASRASRSPSRGRAASTRPRRPTTSGRWTVEVTRPGTFTVTLDQDTLPKGVTLRNPRRRQPQGAGRRGPGQAGALRRSARAPARCRASGRRRPS